ncbi:unnamed protein product [Moneuplotes crassus]|uniref:Amino acid transporter transmembrane domain-containing protein n=1 Tax=Euplotes crassus TaxID=5936 RepID=A0AAD1UEC9_EUPCR|nr:unnamed protein product [Moneuplotes crassus]
MDNEIEMKSSLFPKKHINSSQVAKQANDLNKSITNKVDTPVEGYSCLSSGAFIPSAISLVSATLGAGTVTLPFLAYENGIVLSSILVIIGASISYFCGMLLVRCAIIVKAERYEDFAEYCFGKKAINPTSWCNVLTLLGFVISYIVFVKTLIPHIFRICFPNTIEEENSANQWLYELFSATFYSFCVLLPLGFAREIGTLRYNSIFGVFCTLYLTAMMISMFFLDHSLVPHRLENIKQAKLWDISYTGMMNSIPFVVFAFLYQPNMPMVYRELKKQSYSQTMLVTIAASIFSVAVYILVSSFGYLCTIDEGKAVNILLLKINNFSFQIGIFLFFFVICGSAPMALVPAKDTLEHILKGSGERLSQKENIIVTVIMVVLCYLCAVAVPGITEAITILGCTTNPLSGFLLPIVFYLKIDKDAPKWKVICCYLIFCFIICVSIQSFYLFITED